MTTESLAGEIRKNGQSGRTYVFGFGWASRYNLESIYGEALTGIDTEKDQMRFIANVLMCGLKTKAANNLPADFDRPQMYQLLDDLSEEDVKQVWEVAKHALGFTYRIQGLTTCKRPRQS